MGDYSSSGGFFGDVIFEFETISEFIRIHQLNDPSTSPEETGVIRVLQIHTSRPNAKRLWSFDMQFANELQLKTVGNAFFPSPYYRKVVVVEVARAPGAIRRRSAHKYVVPSNHV